jgi:hypothetical protein
MNAQQARPIQAQIRTNNGYILYFYTVHLWALHIRIKFVLMHGMEPALLYFTVRRSRARNGISLPNLQLKFLLTALEAIMLEDDLKINRP